MRRATWLTLWGIALSATGSVMAAPGPATLRIAFDKNCYKSGDTLTASVIMENLGSPAAGFQAFLHFDNTQLQFVSGSYTPTPFGLPIIFPITATGGGDIDLASGINQFTGQTPTMADATLATLTFTAQGDSGCLGNPGSFLAFRSHNPPTRVSDVDGQSLLPLTLIDSAPFVPGHGTLRLVYSQACYEPGHQVVVSLRMEDICSPVSGFQAFLHFDTTKLSFVSGSYTPTPFGLPVISPITASGGDIDLASGINQFIGQTPTTGDATLATLTFDVTAAADCGGNPLSGIFFRPHNPPTRLTNKCGAELSPLTLIDAPPVAAGPATLHMRFDNTCYKNGDTVTATLRMEGLCDPAAGFQAFLHFDTTKLSFVGGSYTAAPFGLPVLPIFASGGDIDVASGINQFIGQMPTTSDADLVILTFTAIAGSDCTPVSPITFRSHNPPTRVTNICGQALTPLTLIAPPPIMLDGVAPSITCPSAMTVECASDVPGPATDRASFLALSGTSVSDNCDASPSVAFVSDAISNQSCPNRYTITRTYKATDSCGNVGTCTQTITVNDTTAPTVFCPPSIIVQCPSDAPRATDYDSFVAQGGAATDNCSGAISVQFVSDLILNMLCPNHYTIVRTYRVTDACGNSIDCGQTIKVFDTTPPAATCPPNLAVQCAADVPAAATNLAEFLGQGGTASDNCGGAVSVQFMGDVIGGQTCANHYAITRTYRISDSCGNFVDCTQIITVNDNTPPTILCPPAVSVQCASAVSAHATDLASFVGQGGIASDNCAGSVTVAFVGDVISNQTCPNRFTITRTYRATDVCGNSATCDQTITVNDTTAPVIGSCPANISVNADAGSCGAVVNTGTASATDNCDPSPAITFVREDGQASLSAPFSSSFSGSGGTGVTKITWTATDSCGNNSSCTQTVTVAAFNELRVSVQLKGANFPLSLNRCITFELWECPGVSPKATVNQVLTFANALVTNALVLVPCGNYTCITARDKLHTLRRTDTDDFGAHPISGTQYVADFTDKSLLSGDDDSLIGGNLNDDGVIDIVDFALYSGQYNTNYGTGNTTCSTASPHADISGNGLVFTEDFTFIQINFLKQREGNCCLAPNLLSPAGTENITGLSSISVGQLKAKGMEKAVAADLNNDGWVDMTDVALWMQGVRPGQQLPAPAPPRRR